MPADEFAKALAFHRQGRLNDAERICKKIVRQNPRRADGWFLLGAVQFQNENWTSAVEHFERAVGLQPDHAQAHNNLGLARAALSQFDGAMTSFRKAIALKPDFFEAHNNLGRALRESGDATQAIESFQRCIGIEATCADAYFNLGLTYLDLGRPHDAHSALEKAVHLNPGDAEAFNNLGVTLLSMRRIKEAIFAYQRAISLAPGFAEAHYNLGNAHSAAGDGRAAISSYRNAVQVDANHLAAKYNLAIALLEAKQYDDALDVAESIRKVAPDYRGILGQIASAQLAKCDWSNAQATIASIEEHIAAGGSIDPFIAVACGLPAPAQLLCANRALDKQPDPVTAFLPAAADSAQKLRIAYISPDYGDHPVANAIVRVLELHDREKFEIIGVALTRSDGSATRSRIENAVDRMIDVSEATDAEAVATLRDAGIRIAVDVAGHTRNARLGIFRSRVAPIQVNFLGYAGTVGGDVMDYVFADETVLPFDQQAHFAEHIGHLSGTFMPVDTSRAVAGNVDRSSAGLPPEGVVFCCFNQSFKFSSPVFDIWMRLLQSHSGSVLWLSRQPDAVKATLKAEAGRRGVDPGRIIFAARVERIEDHLARLGAADLFLDTLPYNAHSSAADALWAGLPVLTCTGETFAGRVAASLVKAANLPELVVASLDEYERLAGKLASEPETLRALKQRLVAEREAGALFNADAYCRRLEAAFATVSEAYSARAR